MARFRVSKSDEANYKATVKRANRRIHSLMKYIENEEIKSEATQRALLFDYMNKKSWKTEKNPFSSSVFFKSEKDYKDTMRHLDKWGNEKNSPQKIIELVHKDYYKNIISALTTSAIDNANDVLTATGRLPGKLAKKIRELSLEQLTHFFDTNDPTEQIENARWSSDEYMDVDKGTFIDITENHINALKELYPDKGKKKVTSKKTKSKKKKSKRKKPKTKRKR